MRYWGLLRGRQGFLVLRNDMSVEAMFRQNPCLVMRLGGYEIASDRG